MRRKTFVGPGAPGAPRVHNRRVGENHTSILRTGGSRWERTAQWTRAGRPRHAQVFLFSSWDGRARLGKCLIFNLAGRQQHGACRAEARDRQTY